MSILQTQILPETVIKSRWREPYVTEGLNQKALAGDSRGVVAGFRVVPNVGYTVQIATDPALGYSLANVNDTSGAQYSLTLLVPSSLFFDLTAQANSTVFIVLDAQYSVGTDSGAQARVVDAAELLANPDLVLLAKVTVPASPPILTAHINMGYRLSSGDSLTFEALPTYDLVTNGTFERDTTGAAPSAWTAFSGSSLSPTVDATVFRSGTKSLRLSAGAPVTGSVASSFMVVEPAQLIRASAWIRSSGGAPITGSPGVSLSIAWFDSAFSQIASTQLEGVFTGGSTTFEQRLSEVTAPAGAAAAKFVVTYTTVSGTLYIDDVQFLARSGENLARTAVFAGNAFTADLFHSHTAAGLNYAGSGPWADGTTVPAGSIEAAIDNIVAAVGGVSGAAKVGYTPSTPRDLTGVTRVDQALDTLDDEKASLHLTNTFTKTNTFTPSVPNSSGIIASANGTFPAISATADPANSGSAILASAGAGSTATAAILAVAAGTNAGVSAVTTGTGTGLLGQSISGIGVRGVAALSVNPGVRGEGFSSGPGVSGQGGATGAGVTGTGGATSGGGVVGQGGGSGTGVTGTGGATGLGGVFQGGASNHGLLATGGATLNGAIGVDGVGGNTNGLGVRGTGKGNNFGVQGIGGPTSGTGVYGSGGTTNGVGVHGEATGTATGVEGHSPSGTGVRGTSSSASGPGGSFQGGTNGAGVLAEGQGIGAGLLGFGNGAFSTPPNGTGVYGNGFQGVVGLSNDSGSGADGVQGFAGPDGNGVSGYSNATDTANGAAGVYGEYSGGFQGYGVYGLALGGAAGVKGESGDVGTVGGYFTGPGYGAITEGVIGLLARGTTVAIRSGAYIDFTDSGGTGAPPNPAFTAAEYNRLTAKNVTKAWASAVFDSQTPASCRVIDGFNTSGISRSGTTYYLDFITSIGSANKSGTGDSFAKSGIVITFTDSAANFAQGDVGRSIVIQGSTTAANDSPTPSDITGLYVITAVLGATQLQYTNASGVAEAFPGTWSITSTPYAVTITLGDLSGTHLIPYIVESSSTRIGFVMRNLSGTAVNSGIDTLRVTITVTGPQY